MGEQERDDGSGCVEHVWRTTDYDLTMHGTYQNCVCIRCGALLVIGPEALMRGEGVMGGQVHDLEA